MMLVEIKKAVRDSKVIRIYDYSEYNPDLCNNGGCYEYWDKYEKLDNGKFRVSYHTSAEFKFCPVCGMFGDHYDYEIESKFASEHICGDYKQVTKNELVQLIASLQNNDDISIEFGNE